MAEIKNNRTTVIVLGAILAASAIANIYFIYDKYFAGPAPVVTAPAKGTQGAAV